MEIKQLEDVAGLIGDSSRVKILWSLLDGRAYTATELSVFADLSRQNTSMHLSKLVEANILQVSSQGRHRYYSYARIEVAQAIEAIGALVPAPGLKSPEKMKSDPLRYCRTCYDHIAGSVGVTITDQLLKFGYLTQVEDKFNLTPSGKKFFNDFGIDTGFLYKQKRKVTRPCLDWSERRFHLAGSLGAVFLEKLLANDCLRRTDHSRALVITYKGKKELFDLLDIQI
ncbi:MAG: ArsR family transcriptional regulator [Mucilaginibacter sp.]|nr:ArsR family transcriptional regulator [Mucilaginibacter sp.]